MNRSRIFGTVPACLFAFCLSTSTSAAVNSYAQDFEGLNAGDPDALGSSGEGYSVYAEVWDGDVGTSTFLYSYGPFSAPNGGQAFSAIAIGDGTSPPQGDQYLNIYSDYANSDHGNGSGFNINTSVFREYSIDAGDANTSVWTLTFDALANPDNGISDPSSNATASAFIKTIDPNSGYSATNDVRADTTSVLPNAWTSYSISLDLSDPSLEGQLLQFGFNTTARNFENSGVFYDNICFNNTGGCPTPVPTDPDIDGDGIPNAVDADIDGDGIPNAIETTNNLDPLVSADGAFDKDGDGWSNADEYRFGTGIEDENSNPASLIGERTEKVFAADGAASDQFGTSVSVSGATAVIGAPAKDSGIGAAYVFVQSDGIWSQQQRLIVDVDNGVANDAFGSSVSVSGDTAVITARGENSSRGSAYVFTRTAGVWSQQQKLIPSDGGSVNGYFGTSVSVSGDTVLIGAFGFGKGIAYVYVRTGEVWDGGQTLEGGTGEFQDYFGYSVSVSGDTALIGAFGEKYDDPDLGILSNVGSAHVFVRNYHGEWIKQAELTVDGGGAAGDQFGSSVSVSGNTAVIGAVGEESYTGSAYVFVRSSVTWSQQDKLTDDDGIAGDQFGNSVSVSGDAAVIGAYGKNSIKGSAYLFIRSDGVWSEPQQLNAADAVNDDRFGFSVSISGGTLVAGAFRSGDLGGNSGSAYFFDMADSDDDGVPDNFDADIDGDGIPNTIEITNSLDPLDPADGALDKDIDGWSNADEYRFGTGIDDANSNPASLIGDRAEKVFAADAARGDHFGISVSVSGDTAVIGASSKGNAIGAAYVFVHSAGIWSQQQKLIVDNGAVGDRFGSSVSVSGDTAVITAPGENSNSGSAYVFTRTAGEWSRQQRLIAFDGDFINYSFGFSVSVSGDTAVIGARGSKGSAYVFVRTGELWLDDDVKILTASDGAVDDRFGYSVSVSGDTAVIGADGTDESKGSAYVFVRTGQEWDDGEKLTASDGAAEDRFGASVSISADTVVIGAIFDDVKKGSAYVYTHSSDAVNLWSLQQKLTAADAYPFDLFGGSVSVSGDTVVTGAYQDDDNGTVSGLAYFIDLDSDDDGLRNLFEQQYGFDPNVAGEQTQDTDGDGLNNLEEQAAGTNPTVKDTDDDGASDGDEIEVGTDPLDSEDYPPTSAPAAPVITKADYGDGEIYLSVLADRNATRYDASCTDGENTFFGTSNTATITVSGLTNGVPYTCTTTVTNGVGTSAVSELSPAITPEELTTGLPIWLLYEATK